MLVYAKKELSNALLNCEVQFPEWLNSREQVKQEEKEEMKVKKNYYNEIESLSWDKNFKGKEANYIGLIPKDMSDLEFAEVERIPKMQRIE